MRPVSRKYFDRILRHHLQVGLSAGTLPPAGLLQVAETIGHADWQPELLDWRCALAAMLAALPAAMLTPQAVSALLHTSADWADFDESAQLVRSRRTCGPLVADRWSSGRAVGRPRAGRDPRTTTREMGGVLFRDGTVAARGTRRLSLARIRNPCAGARERSRPCRHIGDAGHCGKNCRGSFECTSIED